MAWVVTVMALWAIALTPAWAADNDDVEHLEKRISQLNSMAEKPGVINLAIKRISTETGVPEEQVRKQHRREPDFGLAGLLLANVMAAETKKTPAQFIEQRKNGKKWQAIARDNNVSLDKLNVRLDRLQRDVAPAAKK
jgi:hypothetical protein